MNLLPTTGQALRVRRARGIDPYFRSRLVDAREDKLYIEPPLRSGAEFFDASLIFDASLSEMLWLEYHASNGALCMFPTEIQEVITRPAQWILPRPDVTTIILQQRREFVRAEVDIPVRLELRGGAKVVDVRSYDISGGGIGLWLQADSACAPGDTVSCKFTLPRDNFPVDTQCLIIRIDTINDTGLARASLQFYQMRESVRQKVIQFTFWRQRYLLELFGGREDNDL